MYHRLRFVYISTSRWAIIQRTSSKSLALSGASISVEKYMQHLAGMHSAQSAESPVLAFFFTRAVFFAAVCFRVTAFLSRTFPESIVRGSRRAIKPFLTNGPASRTIIAQSTRWMKIGGLGEFLSAAIAVSLGVDFRKGN